MSFRGHHRNSPARVNSRCALWLIVGGCLLFLAIACAPAQELVPIKGRLTPLMGEGPPPGYIGGDIPDRYRGLTSPFTLRDEEALAAGQRVYTGGAGALSCVVCHGVDGRGSGPRALSMEPRPADFSAPAMLEAFRRHLDYVFWWVSDGVSRTVMPAYDNVLSETERWQVIAYSWYLGEQARGSMPWRQGLAFQRRLLPRLP